MERKAKIIELLEQGLSVREVAMKVGCNPSTVQRAKINRFTPGTIQD